MPSPKRKLGDLGEQIAVDYLKKQRYKILERNYQKPWGEIDIIAQDKNKNIVFVEVKTRKKDNTLINPCFPEQNINFQKKQRLIRTAKTYILEKRRFSKSPWQIDIIAVELNSQTHKADLKHIKNAIWE
ncbi:MAG: YraN family protein [bacterium]